MAVHQQHIRTDRIAADLHVLGQRREHPHAAPAAEAAGGLEMQAASQQLVDELKRLMILDDPVIRSCG